MPSNREKRNAQQRARRARAQSGKSSSHLPNGLTWQPSLAEGKPVQEGEPVVVGHAIAEEPEVVDLPEEMQKLKLNTADSPRFPWPIGPRPPKGCAMHDGKCDESWCPVLHSLQCIRALARNPHSNERRIACENAYAKAKPVIEHAEGELEDARQPAKPDWWDAYHDPFACEPYPRYDGPDHILLRDEPRPGHVWVCQPEEVEIEYTDGRPPKLREWQLPVDELDASYGELPWRISRHVLETLGEHEAERRGQYLKSVAPASSPKAAKLCDCADHAATGLLIDDVQRALQVIFEDTDECSLNELMTFMDCKHCMGFKHTRAQVQRTLRAMDSSGDSSIAYLDGRIHSLPVSE